MDIRVTGKKIVQRRTVDRVRAGKLHKKRGLRQEIKLLARRGGILASLRNKSGLLKARIKLLPKNGAEHKKARAELHHVKRGIRKARAAIDSKKRLLEKL